MYQKSVVKNILVEQGYDNEIYSVNTVDFQDALIEFLNEQKVFLHMDDLSVKVDAPFIDSDCVAGVRAVVSILPLEIDVHMVAFHHAEWDYYINEVQDMVKPCFHDIVLLQTELESGLNLLSLNRLLPLLDPTEDYIPFSTSANNTSAHGFIKANVLEQLDWVDDTIQTFVNNIIGDLVNENPHGIYSMENGTSFFIGYA